MIVSAAVAMLCFCHDSVVRADREPGRNLVNHAVEVMLGHVGTDQGKGTRTRAKRFQVSCRTIPHVLELEVEAETMVACDRTPVVLSHGRCYSPSG